MPDGDRFRTGLTWRWKRVRRSLAARDSIDRTADLLVSALAEDFRRCGGVGDLGSLVATAFQTTHREPTEVVAGSSDMRTRYRLTLATASMQSNGLALTSPLQAGRVLVEKIVADAVRDRIARMLPTLIGPGAYTAAPLVERMNAVLGHAQVTKLCERLIKDPSATRLRAPNRLVKPTVRPDLLNTELDSL